MSPVPAQDNVADGGVTDTELLSESVLIPFASSVASSAFEHLRERKFDIAMPWTTRVAALRFRVPVIGQVRTQKEMVGPHTNTVIARMTDEKSVWHRSMEQFPANTVSVQHATGMSAACESAIAIAERCASPIPTFPRRIDLLPEALGE